MDSKTSYSFPAAPAIPYAPDFMKRKREIASSLPPIDDDMIFNDEASSTLLALKTARMEPSENRPAWVDSFLDSFCVTGRWVSRKQAQNEINLVSLAQNRCLLLDKVNRGGRSLVLRCSSEIRRNSECPFYCKLRRSTKDDNWYICEGFQPLHCCRSDGIPPKYRDIHALFMIREPGNGGRTMKTFSSDLEPI